MASMRLTTNAPAPKALCASEHAKLISGTDGLFPDFGHHSEGEMGGLWMHPIKVLDGFWLRFRDEEADNVDTWILADSYECAPGENAFGYTSGLGHTRVTIRREQLAPESAPGVILTYRLANHDPAPRRVQVEWLARTDLYPAWYSLDSGFCQDGQDSGAWDAATSTFTAKDDKNPWFAAIRCATAPDSAQVGQLFGPQITKGRGVSLSVQYAMTLQGGEERELTFYLTGSAQTAQQAQERLALLASGKDFRAEKQARYDALLAQSRLEVPDERFREVWDWVKVNTDWLIVDSAPYGRALSAGMPEYPWWFSCDNCYTIQGLLAMGQYELARETLKLLADYSEKVNGNGRIVHEITTYGLCSNPGNTQETAHFVTALWNYWRWTGDRSLIDETMPLVRKSMAWLQAQDDDGDLFPSGYGIIEIAGLNAEMIDSIAYTAQAWGCYADLCRLTGDSGEEARARELYQRTCQAMNDKMWDEEAGSYCDAYASTAFVRSCRDEILGRRHGHNPEAERAFDAMLARKDCPEDQETGFLINGNWTLVTPMEAGLAPADKAERALAYMNTPEFVGKWGVYLNALNRDAIMTISTGAAAVAQARYGHADRALDLLKRMNATFGMATPGMISEMSPDYGCFCQAWTAYALFTPVVRHIFGVQPEADKEQVTLTPCMPAAWPEASLTDVRVLDGKLSIRYARQDKGYTLTLSGENCPALRLNLQPGETAAVTGAQATDVEGGVRFTLPQGETVQVTVSRN